MLAKDEIKNLKARAHKLKPVVMIGQHGLSESVLKEIDSTLAHHELIKIKIAAEDKGECLTLGEAICEQLKAEFIQSIGHVIVIYRKKPEI